MSAFKLGRKDPVPEVDQAALVAKLMLPESGMDLTSEQTVLSAPAFGRGCLLMVISIKSVTGLHVPFPVVCNVSPAEPVAISAAERI